MKTEHNVIQKAFLDVLDFLFKSVNISLLQPVLESHHLHYKGSIHEGHHKGNPLSIPILSDNTKPSDP